jgi:hypothetical protein
MRKKYPSERWLKQFDAAFVENGGHSGAQTLKVCRAEYAIPLYRRGAPPRAAGLAAVLAYRLHRRVTDLQEQVDSILSDVRTGRVPLELAHLGEGRS